MVHFSVKSTHFLLWEFMKLIWHKNLRPCDVAVMVDPGGGWGSGSVFTGKGNRDNPSSIRLEIAVEIHAS